MVGGQLVCEPKRSDAGSSSTSIQPQRDVSVEARIKEGQSLWGVGKTELSQSSTCREAVEILSATPAFRWPVPASQVFQSYSGREEIRGVGCRTADRARPHRTAVAPTCTLAATDLITLPTNRHAAPQWEFQESPISSNPKSGWLRDYIQRRDDPTGNSLWCSLTVWL